MLGTGGHNYGVAIFYVVSRSVNDHTSASAFEPKELIILVMGLEADLLLWFEAHKYKLQVLPAV